MFNTSIHIQDENVIVTEEQMGEECLEHGTLGANATGAAQIHRAHLQ